MSFGGSGASSYTSTTTLIPDWAQAYVEQYLNEMNTLSQTAYQTYTGSLYASQNADEIDGIAGLINYGTSGDSNGIITKAETLIRNTIDALKFNVNSFRYNAYLKKADVIIKKFQEDTLPRLNQEFNLSHNYADYSHHWAQAKAAEEVMAGLQEAGADIYFKDYQEEKILQFRTFGHAILYGTQDGIRTEILRQAGAIQKEYTQGGLETDYKKWQDVTQSPVKRLALLENGLKAVIGSNSSVTEPYYRPTALQQLAGLAIAGLGVYGMYKKPATPYGMASLPPETPILSSAGMELQKLEYGITQ